MVLVKDDERDMLSESVNVNERVIESAVTESCCDSECEVEAETESLPVRDGVMVKDSDTC